MATLPSTTAPDTALAHAFRDAYANAQQENASILKRMIRMERQGKTESEDFVEPETLKEVHEELDIYITHLITALADAKTREDQSYILQDYLHEVMQAVLFSGKTSLSFEALLNVYEGAEAQLTRHYKSDEHPWFERFSEVQEYGEMCYDTIFDMYMLVEAEQIARGIPENERDDGPYHWAVTRYLKNHPELPRDQELTDAMHQEIMSEAQEIVTECIEPFVGCLPIDIPLEAAWFICRANELHDEGNKPIQKRIVDAGPKPFLARLENLGVSSKVLSKAPPIDIANDNDDSLELALKSPHRIAQIHDTLTHIFLCNLDAGSNLDHLLSAKSMLEEKSATCMRAAKQPAARKGKGVSMLSTLDAQKQLMLEAAKRAKEETQERFESWRRELIEAVAENEEDQWLKDMLEDKDTLADYAEDFHTVPILARLNKQFPDMMEEPESYRKALDSLDRQLRMVTTEHHA